MRNCGTLFPNQQYLDQRALNVEGIFDEEAPRGPDYANPDFDPLKPIGPDNPTTLTPQPWRFVDPHSGDSTALRGGMSCFQPMVKLEADFSYMDN